MPTNSSPRLAKLVLPLMLPALILSGCAKMTALSGSANTKIACEAFKPIGWEDADTDATIAEVKSHNAAYKAVCPQ